MDLKTAALGTVKAVAGAVHNTAKLAENAANLGNTAVKAGDTIVAKSGDLTGKTLDATGNVMDATVKVVKATGDLGANTLQSTGKVVKSTGDFGANTLNAAANITKNTGELATTAISSLNTATNSLMITTNNTFKDAGQAVGGITKGVSDSILSSITLGTTAIDSVTTLLSVPFKFATNEYKKQQEKKLDPNVIGQKLRRDVVRQFIENKTLILKSWKIHFLSLIKIMEESIKLFEKIGCAKNTGFFSASYKCNTEIQQKMKAIQIIKTTIYSEMETALLEIDRVLSENSLTTGINPLTTKEEIDTKQAEYAENQNRILIQATKIYEYYVTKFTEDIKKVKDEIHSLKTSITSILGQQSVNSQNGTPAVPTNGGKRRKRTNKKSRRKRRRSQKRK